MMKQVLSWTPLLLMHTIQRRIIQSLTRRRQLKQLQVATKHMPRSKTQTWWACSRTISPMTSSGRPRYHRYLLLPPWIPNYLTLQLSNSVKCSKGSCSSRAWFMALKTPTWLKVLPQPWQDRTWAKIMHTMLWITSILIYRKSTSRRLKPLPWPNLVLCAKRFVATLKIVVHAHLKTRRTITRSWESLWRTPLMTQKRTHKSSL